MWHLDRISMKFPQTGQYLNQLWHISLMPMCATRSRYYNKMCVNMPPCTIVLWSDPYINSCKKWGLLVSYRIPCSCNYPWKIYQTRTLNPCNWWRCLNGFITFAFLSKMTTLRFGCCGHSSSSGKRWVASVDRLTENVRMIHGVDYMLET